MPTSGPYAWWLIGLIRKTELMSAVRTAASASRSNERQAAAVDPDGQVTGPAGPAVVASSWPAAESSAELTASSEAVMRASIRLAAGVDYPTAVQTSSPGS